MAFTRQQIVNRLRKQIADGRPILGTGASNGIIGKCAEEGGADIIIMYSTGRTRMMGIQTTMIEGYSNPITLDMFDEVKNVVHDTPIIGGVEANDIYVLDLEKSVQRFVDKGFDGFINFPTVSLKENLLGGGPEGMMRKYNASFAPGYKQDTWGWQREVDMIRLLHEKDIFTMVYAVTTADAEDMTRAGADVVCVHVGPSRGGLAGYAMTGHDDKGIVALMEYSQDMIDAARAINPEVFVLLHGGPFDDPESTGVIYEKTTAQGFVAASAFERVPIERALVGAAKAFKNFEINQ